MTLVHISRTSGSYDIDENGEVVTNSPCEGAVWLPYLRKDTRWCTEQYYNENIAMCFGPDGSKVRSCPDWRDAGKNHREEVCMAATGDRTVIVRDFDTHGWFLDVDFSNMEAVVEKFGPVVVTHGFDSDLLSMEIYDDYRE